MTVYTSFFDQADTLVVESLEGLTMLNPELVFNKSIKSIFNANHDSTSCVSLISGGGAGHEPAHAAFVGTGMLSAAVSGNVFASPSASQIFETIRTIDGKSGTILIIKNYTGDVFHFHIAAEQARAQLSSKIEVLVIGDDVAVGRKKNGKVGRRGLAGTILVHKILGAMSASGKSFKEIIDMGRSVANNLATCGVSQGHVSIPGSTSSTSAKPQQVELGMGIHNEPGCHILDPRPKLDDLLAQMLEMLTSLNDADRSYVKFTDTTQLVLLVNNLGGTSVLELTAITKRVSQMLKKKGLQVVRVLAGTFMTSLNAPGFSVTLLGATSEMIKYLDSPASALGWSQNPSGACRPNGQPAVYEQRIKSNGVEIHANCGWKINIQQFREVVSSAANSLLAAEDRITEYDTLVGDGDCGATLRRGAEAVLETLASDIPEDAGLAMVDLAQAIGRSMDGTSGAIFELFFNALASQLLEFRGTTGIVDLKVWATAAQGALKSLQNATPARVGDRTLMDALDPFITVLAKSQNLATAVTAARVGRDDTIGMTPSLGRAVYVDEAGWGKVPDPGAEGILAIVRGLLVDGCEDHVI